MENESLSSRMRSVFAASGAVRAVFLFGSRAGGRARADSDVDLGFLPSDAAMTLADEAALQRELERATGLAVDLVRLDLAGPLLQWEVARHARVVWSDSAEEATRWLVGVGIAHAEAAPLVEAGARRYLQRIAAGVR